MVSYFATESLFAGEIITMLSQKWGISVGAVAFILFVIIVWTVVWKLLALWKAARKGSVIWFIVLALFNTVGILPILYIYVFSEMKLDKKPSKKTRKKKK